MPLYTGTFCQFFLALPTSYSTYTYLLFLVLLDFPLTCINVNSPSDLIPPYPKPIHRLNENQVEEK